MKADVLRVLNLLPMRHRAVVELTFVEGMSYRDIATTLGIPIGTVKSRMSYAIDKLTQALKSFDTNRDESL